METDKNIKLEISKDFPVTVERLYKAWTAPEDLKQWWHPMGNKLQHANTKPRQDGAIEYIFANDKGERILTISGTYKEVQEGARLVYSWNWQLPDATLQDSAYNLIVVFSAHATGSRISVIQENFKDDEALHPHREGWEKAFNELHAFLTQQQ